MNVRIADLDYRSEYNKIIKVGEDHIVLENKIVWPPSKNSKVFLAYPVDKVKIMNVNVRNSEVGVLIENGRNVTINNVKFEGISGDVVDVKNSVKTEISGSTFVNNGLTGLASHSLHSESSFETEIRNSKSYSSGPVWIRYDNYAVIKNNVFNGTYPAGGDIISKTSSNNVDVKNNLITNSNCYGIWIKNNSSYNTITNNEISHGITSGIYISNNSNYNKIEENLIRFNRANGIFVDSHAYWNRIFKNRVYENGARGILIHSDQYIMKDNFVYNNTLANIFINP